MHWLLEHLVSDVETLRHDCGLPQASTEIEALAGTGPEPVIDRIDAPGDLTGAVDLVIVDAPERLDSRARLKVLSARPLPLRTCSLYAVTDEPDEAADAVAHFRQRLQEHTFTFAAKIVAVAPPSVIPLAAPEPSAYLVWLIKRRLEEAIRLVCERIRALPPIDKAIFHEIKEDIAREQEWMRKRFAGLRADLNVALRESSPRLHAQRLLEAVENDVAERYGVAKPTLVDLKNYSPEKPKRRRGRQIVEIGVDVVLAIKTAGISLLRRLAPLLDRGSPPDPRDDALLRLFDRDLRRTLEDTMRRIDLQLTALATARAAARHPAYADLQLWRGIAGRALALRKRHKLVSGV